MEKGIAYVSRDAYDGRNDVVDERFRRDKERLDAQEKAISEMQRLTIEMAGLNQKYDEQLKRHENRLCTLEKQPADQWGKVKSAAISAVVSGAVVYVITALTK